MTDIRSKQHKPYPTQERLKELFSYDRDTGEFSRLTDWIAGRGKGHIKAIAGSRAGSVTAHGYRVISVDGDTYFEHILAWIYAHGTRPNYVDHVDLNRSNNRIENLRECDKSQNQANAGCHVDSSSGYKGVSWSKHAKRWRATIGYEKKVIHLGYFTNPEEAHAAYASRAKELFGDFARAS